MMTWPPSLFQKIGAAVAVGLLAIIFFSIRGCQSRQYERDLAVAEERKNQAEVLKLAAEALEAQKRKFEAEAKAEQEAHDKERADWAKEQLALTRSVLARNEATERRIAVALAPKTTEQVAEDAKQTLGIAPPVQNGLFQLTAEELQKQIAVQIDRDRLAGNLKETEQQLSLEKQANATLRADLDKANKTIELANQTIALSNQTTALYRDAAERYEKVARKGFWRKSADVGGKVGLAFVAAYIWSKLAR